MSRCQAITLSGKKCKIIGTHEGFCHHHYTKFCGICLEDCNTKNMYHLHCGHFFCEPCLTPWILNNKNSCPTCRGTVHQHIIRGAHTMAWITGYLFHVSVTIVPLTFTMIGFAQDHLIPLHVKMTKNNFDIFKQMINPDVLKDAIEMSYQRW